MSKIRFCVNAHLTRFVFCHFRIRYVLFACTKTAPLYMAGFVRRNEDSYEFFEKKLAAVFRLLYLYIPAVVFLP